MRILTLALVVCSCNIHPRTDWRVRALQNDLVSLQGCNEIVARRNVYLPTYYNGTTFRCDDGTTREIDTDRADRLVATRALIAQLKAAGWKSE